MTTKVLLLFAGSLVFGLLVTPTPASAQYRDLCDSAQICEYTGPSAPVLDADVCMDPAGEVRLKGSTPCSGGAWPFHVRYGEVYDPLRGLVVAYMPLENACAQGLCVELQDGGDGGPLTVEEGICCIGAICWPGYDCGGTLFWCNDGVSNEDGTVTCFEGEEVFD